MVQENTTNRSWPIPEAGTKPWYEAFKLLMNTTDADFQDMLDDLGLNTTTGFMRIEYDDVFPGGPWVTPSGASAPDDVTATIGGVSYRCKGYDGANTEELQANTFEIVHGIACDEVAAGTNKLEFHVHSMPSTTGAGTVQWWFDWAYVPAGGDPLPQTAVSVTETYTSNSQYHHYVKGVEITVPSCGIGDIIIFNLRRTPSGDTYAGDALLLQAAMHAPFNSRGSRERYIK